MSYSVDTSALLDWWVRYYPPDVFLSLKRQIEALADNGKFLIIDEVQRELQKKDDDLYKWTSDDPNMIVAIDTEIQSQARVVIKHYPSLTQTKSAMGGSADPFVIAMAQVRGLTVVTAEAPRPSRPRIPDACRGLAVPCINLLELFRREYWQI
jgi:hypothetical protein